MVVEDDSRLSNEIMAVLSAGGFRADRVEDAAGARAALDRDRPDVVITGDRGLATGGAFRAAADLGIPVLVVADETADLASLAARLTDADDWVARRALSTELPARVARLLKRRQGRTAADGEGDAAAGRATQPQPGGTQFLSLIVHDLRTPLNVIGLSLRMVGQALPKGDPELEEDLRFIEENLRQIERMLTLLSDYFRLFDPANPLGPTPFSPWRMVDVVL
jgi:signal transduction histidine kinase